MARLGKGNGSAALTLVMSILYNCYVQPSNTGVRPSARRLRAITVACRRIAAASARICSLRVGSIAICRSGQLRRRCGLARARGEERFDFGQLNAKRAKLVSLRKLGAQPIRLGAKFGAKLFDGRVDLVEHLVADLAKRVACRLRMKGSFGPQRHADHAANVDLCRVELWGLFHGLGARPRGLRACEPIFARLFS